jgi:hypothetical protein
MSIQCSQGHVNPDNATFCDECGEPLPAAQSLSLGDEPTVVAPTSTPDADVDATIKATHPPISPAMDATESVPSPSAAEEEDVTLPAPSAPAASAPAPAPAPTPEPVAAPAWTPPPAPVPPPPAPVAAPAQPHLIVEGNGTTFDLSGKNTFVLGREDPPSNSFPDFDLTPYGAEEGGVSRLHARLTLSGDVWSIEDLESTNFTFINRKRVTPKTPTPLNDGDEIRLGRIGLRFKTTA